jgi:EmrB/QacA subfamily drug resistance transporter
VQDEAAALSRDEKAAVATEHAGESANPNQNTNVNTTASDSSSPSDNGPPSDTPKDGSSAGEPEAQRTRLQTTLIVTALCIALFLAALDMTIITTAVPTISAHFHSTTGYVWIGSAYMLGSAALVPTWGKLSDIFGRKPIILTAVTVFWIGSLLCAVSRSMGMLIAARAIQGIGGGGTIVLPNICVSDLFSMRNRGFYFGVFGMTWALASAIGPILGGVFTSQVSWRWCFYINLPLGGVAMVILVLVLKLHNPRTPMKEGLAAIDWPGNLLIIGGTLMFLFGLEFGGTEYPWDSATVICLIVFGVVTIVVFAFYESRVATYPVIPIRLFHKRTSVACYAVSIEHAFTFISGSYWLPLYFQAVLGANSLLSGVYLLPFVFTLSLVSGGVGFFTKKTGNYKIPIVGGMFFMTIGFGLFTYLGDRAHWPRIIIFQMIAGLGVGTNFQSPLIGLQTNVEPRDIGSATSSLQFIRQLGTATSVAVGGVIFNNVMQQQQPHLIDELGIDVASQFTGDNAAANVQAIKSLPPGDRQVARTAYWNALQKMYIAFVCVSFLGLLTSFLVKQTKLSKQHTEHKTGLATLKAERKEKNPASDEEKVSSVANRPGSSK